MKTGSVLLIGGLIAGGWYLSQLAFASDTVQFVFDGVSFKGVLDYIVRLKVQNISNGSATLRSLSGTISVNGNPIGNISDFDGVTIPGNSEQPINIEVRPDILSLPLAIKDLLNNAHGNFDFHIEGTANVSGFPMPFTLDKSISV